MDCKMLETEFEEDFLELLSINYGVEKEKAFQYVLLRYLIINNKDSDKNLDIRDFIKFIRAENNLPKEILYQGEQFDYDIFFTITKSLLFELSKILAFSSSSLKIEDYLKCKEIISKSKNAKFKHTSIFKELITLDRLRLLKEDFNATMLMDSKMSNLVYYDYQKSFLYEDILEKKINLFLSNEKNRKNIVSEKDIENFLKEHLNLIEDGLSYIGNQIDLQNGFIDILARDSNNVDVIIELKIHPDERLIWQSIFYPKQYKKLFNKKKIRMICLCPNYPYYIKDCLDELDVEKFQYDFSVDESFNITNIVCEKID